MVSLDRIQFSKRTRVDVFAVIVRDKLSRFARFYKKKTKLHEGINSLIRQNPSQIELNSLALIDDRVAHRETQSAV